MWRFIAIFLLLLYIDCCLYTEAKIEDSLDEINRNYTTVKGYTDDEYTPIDQPQTLHINAQVRREMKDEHILTRDGYFELENMFNKCYKLNRYARFVKFCINKSHMLFSILQSTSSVLSIFVPEDNGLMILYFLIMSGIEQNPGPVDGFERERKRFRKSGLTYRSYLTDRSTFETAPSKMKLEIGNMEEPAATLAPTASTSAPSASTSHNEQNIVTQDEEYFTDTEKCEDALRSDEDKSSDKSDNELGFISDETNLLDSDSEPEESNFSTQENFEEEFDKMHIYDGAQITVGASVLLIMTFVMNYNLTGEAFSDLIDLIQLHCKEANLIPQSTYELKKWFRDLKISPIKHYYCGKCLYSIDETCQLCPNTKCNKRFESKHERSYFVEVSIIEQLRKLFREIDFRKKIINPFERIQERDTVSDIYDGQFYKTLMSQDKIKQNDLTFTWNTDGVPLFKSSKTSMWPLFLAINELPYKIRRKPENLLLVGLWIGPKKPEMLTFLKPFINDLQDLENGIAIETETPLHLLRGFLISGTADLPAKCTVNNMIQFNGKYSCHCCQQPGETAPSGKGIAHVFPFKFDGPTSPKRTHQQSIIQAETATNNGKTENGIKGPCWFTQLCLYDFVKSNCIDYMHCVLLGVTKKLISLWFSKDFSAKPYSCFQQVDCMNKRLAKLKPPLFVKRAPRSLADLKYWKASEYKSFLLFYGPVVLIDILRPSQYRHFLLLSESIYILLKESITIQELNTAENMLEHFIASFDNLYESRFLTLNFHLLLHLPENVRQLGPIWGYSCFPFEDANGILMKLVKGTQSVHSQLLDSVSILHGLPYLEKNCIQSSSKAEQLLNRMKRRSTKNATNLSENVVALGKVSQMDVEKVPQDCYVALARFFNTPPFGNILKFKRIKLNGNVLHSREYTRVKVRNSYCVCFTENGGTLCYGLVHYFVSYTPVNTNSKFIMAIITGLVENVTRMHFPYDPVIEERQMQHFNVFYEPNFMEQSKAILVKDIKQLCVLMTSENKDFFTCRPPNTVEME